MIVGLAIIEGDFARRLAQQAKAWEADCIFLGMPQKGCRRGNILNRAALVAAACAPCSVEAVRSPAGTAEFAVKPRELINV